MRADVVARYRLRIARARSTAKLAGLRTEISALFPSDADTARLLQAVERRIASAGQPPRPRPHRRPPPRP
ncbi:MAG TPA: hypothetical protein VEI06_05245 [Gemmatimonadaceae bacterium]|nr:hypothetical protein [Gemmatimonadaceae bacterium]